MKLYNRDEFLALPAGVVFSKFDPYCFGDWLIKGDTLPPNDFQYQFLAVINSSDYVDQCEDFLTSRQAGVDFYGYYRDGLYDSDQLFAVLDSSEVRGLIARLEEALLEGYKQES